MTVLDVNRRTVLQSSGSAVAFAFVAGCLGADEPDPTENGNDAGDGGSGGDDSYDFDGWFDDVDNYDGVHDRTGQEAVTVTNGTGTANMRYDPAAILVDAGTTVTWEWTGLGGSHDVTHEDGAFESGLKSAEGDTFSHAFEEAGTYLYYCTPHRTNGQKGAVIVE